MNQQISLDHLIQFGDNNFRDKYYDTAIRYYSRAFSRITGRQNSETAELSEETRKSINLHLYTRMAQSYSIKGSSDPAFYIIAIEKFQQAIAISPDDRELHDGLIYAAHKSHKLDNLLTEYKAKLSESPENDIYKSCVNKIHKLSSFHIDVQQMKVKIPGYKPHLFIRIAFDYVIFPSSLFLMIFAVIKPKYKSFFNDGIGMILLYFVYRYFISRK